MRIVHLKLFTVTLLTGTVCIALTGCDQDSSAPTGNSGGTISTSASLPDGLILAAAPPGATPVAELKRTAKEGEQVVMRVVVGGRKKPIVENRSVMTVVDVGLNNQCVLPGDSCKTPWDYCCASPEQLRPNLATVQIVDDQGRPLAIDLLGASKLEPLAVLVVKGSVGPRPDPGTLVINASGLFVESTP